ncbi:MAG: hypothetical protein DRQ43_08270 [Gammaproteobacteria bacterium]|nr:MAG: hypothetical protein DRQ43_08270 [Gammaproteobacteria bacterium]
MINSINKKKSAFQNNKKRIALEKLLKNDKFIQYIVSTYLPTSDMTYLEKIQDVFSSTKEFTAAMDRFKLTGGMIAKH